MEQAVEVLREAVKSEDPEVVRLALGALGSFGASIAG
jgi:hypothetical protein